MVRYINGAELVEENKGMNIGLNMVADFMPLEG